MIKPKHIPIRTCVACRTSDAKRGLLRVVRQPDGVVVYDSKGKLPGRGAYLCAQATCIALARKQKKLERSLKASAISDSLYQELELQVLHVVGESVTADLALPPNPAGSGDGLAAVRRPSAAPLSDNGPVSATARHIENCGTAPRESEE